MQEVKRVLRQAARRLFLQGLLRALIVAASAALAGFILLRMVQQTFGLAMGGPEWWTAAAVAGGAAALGAIVWAIFARRSASGVARELDERANLRESLSTALCVERDDDPWCRAVIETARDRATRVVVRDAMPYESPRFWPVPLALAIALVVVWFAFPPLDVLGLFRKQAQTEELELARQQANIEVTAAIKPIEDALRQAKVDLGTENTPENPDGDPDAAKTPEDIRRAALKQLTSMQDKLGEAKSGEKAKKMDALRQAMKQVKQPGPGPLDQMTKSLQQGNFKQAQADLDELSKKLAEDSMSPEDKAKLKEQLAKLSEQLAKLGEERKEMEKKLEQAGLSKDDAKKLAMDPEALRQALEKMQNLSEEQKQQLMKAAKAASEACKQCSGMGSQMGKMAQGMSQQGMDSKGSESMEAMAGMLSEMEMTAAELDSLDAAMKECQGALARIGDSMCRGDGQGGRNGVAMVKPWQAGEGREQGMGQGGPGRGYGGEQTPEEAATNSAKAKANVKQQNGPIIGSRLVYGDTVKGEAVAEFAQAVEAAAKEAADEVNGKTIPREYHDAVKRYFGRLEARTKANAGQPLPAAPPAPTAPTAPDGGR